MKKQLSAVALTMISAVAMANTKVDSSIIGKYKLLSNLEGECPETLVVTEKENTKYSVWISFYNENAEFISNNSFSNLNEPVEISSGTCFTAGPVNPFCMEIRKELVKYDEQNLVLEKFKGNKKTYNTAKLYYTKLAVKDGSQLEVTYREFEKPMAYAQFNFTPIESAVTNTAYYTFPIFKKNFSCNYGK